MDGLLLKEGVYCAVGNSPSELESYINFGHWLDNTLASEAAGTDSKSVTRLALPEARSIHRSVANVGGVHLQSTHSQAEDRLACRQLGRRRFVTRR